MDRAPIFKKYILPALKYLGLFAFSAAYLLVFSLWTTPMYKGWYGCDASFFTMAGRGITKGWVPYVDFFDLKGPYFFFIQALGQLFARARTGAFILQCVSLFVTLVIIVKLLGKFDKYISASKKLFITAVFLFFHIATLWGGNTLEEFMLPLSLLSLYAVIPNVSKPCMADHACENPADFPDITSNISPLSGLITGICFGIIMFSKITVAAPVAGIVIAVVITCIRKKEYKKLIIYMLYALAGVLLMATPLFIYFGLHNAIQRMLYSVFIFAFKRSVDFGQKFNLRWELKISGCYFAMIFVAFQSFPNINKLLKSRKEQNQISQKSDLISFLLTITFFMALITAVLLHFGDPFIYYFTTVYPTLIAAFIAMFIIYSPFELFKSIRLDIPLVFFGVTLCYFASQSASTLNTVIYDRENTYYMDYVNKAKEMASLIPERDKDDVYSFNMDMQWFEINEILPCYTYTINLQFFVALDNNIETEIIDRLNTKPPKWLVVGGDLSTYLPNINDVVMKKYINIYDNDYGSLYLLYTE